MGWLALAAGQTEKINIQSSRDDSNVVQKSEGKTRVVRESNLEEGTFKGYFKNGVALARWEKKGTCGMEGCEGREGGILVGTQEVQSVPVIVCVNGEYHPREGRSE